MEAAVIMMAVRQKDIRDPHRKADYIFLAMGFTENRDIFFNG